MSSPCEFIQLSPKVVSLAFEEKLSLDFTALNFYFKQRFPELEEVTFTFNRINLIFLNAVTLSSLQKTLFDLNLEQFSRKPIKEYWELPICFDPSFTKDLELYFNENQEAIRAYRSAFLSSSFVLEFYGFLPGFGYMSGLPKALELSRKKNPNRKTKKGTVAVGGKQLGVYPQDSPGGWQGIGHCPVPWFSPQQESPELIQIGDAIRFVEVDLKECQSIALSVEMEVYQPKKIAP